MYKRQGGVYAEARAANRGRNVSEQFGQQPQVVADDAGTGVASSELFFPSSDTLVISGPSDAAQLRAASIGVVSHAPVLRFVPGQSEQIMAELDRLGATTVLTVGDVDLPATGEDVEVFADDGSMEALGEITAKEFEEQTVATPEEMVEATAALDPEANTCLLYTSPSPRD